jgi:hypothetical protein
MSGSDGMPDTQLCNQERTCQLKLLFPHCFSKSLFFGIIQQFHLSLSGFSET